MTELKFNIDLRRQCETPECLTRCQHMDFDVEQARVEKQRILDGEDSRVLKDGHGTS